MADIPYQQAGQVRQLLAERENAVIYGQTERIKACDKQLRELGYDVEQLQAKTVGDKPQGRSTRPQETTTTSKPRAVTAKQETDAADEE